MTAQGSATGAGTLEAFIRDLLGPTPEPAREWLATATPAELAELRLELAVILERRREVRP